MGKVTTDELFDELTAALEQWPVRNRSKSRFVVALSGGLDSTFLLALLVKAGFGGRLRAIHVDHGLHPDSEAWLAFCSRIAEEHGVPFASVKIQIDAVAERGSIEALARDRRYRAFAELMRPGEILLTAHHANDQLETVLFRLVRGAGVRGMRGIIPFSDFGPGHLARPLLAFSKNTIAAQAADWGLRWIDDPSNLDVRYDRNFLRREIVPNLIEHWPRAPEAAVRLTRSMLDAEALLDDIARIDARGLADIERIPRTELRALPGHRTRNLLRHVIRRLGLPLPNATQMDELTGSLTVTRADAGTLVSWPGAEARVYRDHLYLQAPLSALPANCGRTTIAPGRAIDCGAGYLSLEAGTDAGLPDEWARLGVELRFRAGGERFKPLGAAHERPLKKWLQEAGVVPWMRPRIPLLVKDDVILAVGDIWIGDALKGAARRGPTWRVRWSGHPRLY